MKHRWIAQMTPLAGKTILVTGGARRVGRALAISAARAGANIILHHGHSPAEAKATCQEIVNLGRQAAILEADFSDPIQVSELIEHAFSHGPVDALVNSAAIFEPLDWQQTTLEDWDRHLFINLTVPFLLSQAFARRISPQGKGRIVNILDWRALRPGADHLPYTISKAALAALTRSLAQALAPGIQVNGLALGAILPPSDGAVESHILENVPARRWAELDEVGEALIFLLSAPGYITGEIIHIDGGRHLV